MRRYLPFHPFIEEIAERSPLPKGEINDYAERLRQEGHQIWLAEGKLEGWQEGKLRVCKGKVEGMHEQATIAFAHAGTGH